MVVLPQNNNDKKKKKTAQQPATAISNALTNTTAATPTVQPITQPTVQATSQPTQPQTSALPGSASSINLSEMLNRANRLLAPGTQAQKDTLQSSFNQGMQKLNNQFASRGLLASGVAASQQAQAVQALAGQMAQIDAAQQEKALQTAMQQQQFLEGQRQFDKGFSLEEAATTGNYIPMGTRDMINSIVQQKRAWSAPGATQEQKDQAHQQANIIRDQLRIMGIDPSMFSADDTIEGVLKNAERFRGTQTQAAREADRGFALEEGQLTGRYLPPGARDLIERIVQEKRLYSQPGASQQSKDAAASRAQALRDQLQVMGIDASQFGADVSIADTLRNAERLTGTPTQAAREFDQQIELERDRFGFEKTMGEWEMAFKDRQQEIDRDLAQQGLDVDRARVAISRLSAQTDAEYKNHLMELDIDEQTALRRTNATIADVINMGSADEVYEYLMKNAQNIHEDGVDVRSVLEAVNDKFGGSSSGLENPFLTSGEE